jgi:hypothetical protein
MKLRLPAVETLKQFNIRLPESLKAELTQLREECERDHLDFNAAITGTLRAFATSLRAELTVQHRRSPNRSASENGSRPLASPAREYGNDDTTDR